MHEIPTPTASPPGTQPGSQEPVANTGGAHGDARQASCGVQMLIVSWPHPTSTCKGVSLHEMGDSWASRPWPRGGLAARRLVLTSKGHNLVPDKQCKENRNVLAPPKPPPARGQSAWDAHPSSLALGLIEAPVTKSEGAKDGYRPAVQGYFKTAGEHFHFLKKAPPASEEAVHPV